MKKVLKRTVILMIAASMVVMTGCGDKQMQQEDSDVNSLLQEVTEKSVTNTEETSKETSKETAENISYDALLQGEAKLQTLDGKSVSLTELVGNRDVNYVIMDLDKDGEDELFILASPVSALIKNVDGEYKMIYDGCGYDVPINTDGLIGVLYAYPGDAPLHDIFRYTEFESGKKTSETVASWYDANENREMDAEDWFYLGENEKEVTMEEWLAVAGKFYEHRNDDIDWKVIAGKGSENSDNAALDTEGQLELLEKEAAVWQLSEEAHGDFTEATDFANYGFAVTDLDNDGMLEVIKSGWAGTGHYSMNYIYEVTAEGTLEAIDTSALEEMKSQPDLFMEGIRSADNADKNAYIVIDMEYGAGRNDYTYYEMRMENNRISLKPCQEPEAVDALLDNAFWFKDITAENLKKSYEGFCKTSASAANTSAGNTLTAKVHNDYFFTEGSKEYTYKVKNFFLEDPDEITVKLQLLANYENGDVYSLTVQYEDIPERTYSGMDRYALGTFYVTEDSIYMEEQCEKIPTEEEFLTDSMLIYSKSGKPQNPTDYETKIEEEGDNYKFSFWNPLVESGYYCNMTWTKDKGLTYFRNGFGAEADPIEIELK
ncbi:hypothetical protein [Butyrivibrio sp. AE3009]|uniref:hypothetical protein n=1 Tax=Butyrivibrio sp. AE3009 TaxID=1280666 RepID=UPI0003FACE0B|nr:hypothetical protein [Butyrivibrio sp. AE3009]